MKTRANSLESLLSNVIGLQLSMESKCVLGFGMRQITPCVKLAGNEVRVRASEKTSRRNDPMNPEKACKIQK